LSGRPGRSVVGGVSHPELSLAFMPFDGAVNRVKSARPRNGDLAGGSPKYTLTDPS